MAVFIGGIAGSRKPKKVFNVKFNYKGESHNHSFTPKESDWWGAFKSKGKTFDIHYDEDYGDISVYEVIKGRANYENIVYNKRIR